MALNLAITKPLQYFFSKIWTCDCNQNQNRQYLPTMSAEDTLLSVKAHWCVCTPVKAGSRSEKSCICVLCSVLCWKHISQKSWVIMLTWEVSCCWKSLVFSEGLLVCSMLVRTITWQRRRDWHAHWTVRNECLNTKYWMYNVEFWMFCGTGNYQRIPHTNSHTNRNKFVSRYVFVTHCAVSSLGCLSLSEKVWWNYSVRQRTCSVNLQLNKFPTKNKYAFQDICRGNCVHRAVWSVRAQTILLSP